jgi:hypothetical protein
MTGDTDSKSALGEWLYAASAYGKHVSPEADIIAPASNIPASTSLLETQQVEPATGEDLAKQHIVRKLVTLQAHDGSFDSNKEQLPMLFGPMFLTGVEHLGYDLVMHLLPESANKVSSVSLALAVAALLTSQFQSCENLWRLMAAKAKAFASRHIQTDGYLELEKRALGLFATFNLPTYSLRKFDLQSFVGLLGPIDPGSGTTGETQSNDPPNQLEASHEQGSPTDPKIQQPPAAGVPRQDNDSNDQFTAIQPATERCTSLEFAPYEDDDSD